VRLQCEHCEEAYDYWKEDLLWSDSDHAYECPKCGCCFFAIIKKEASSTELM